MHSTISTSVSHLLSEARLNQSGCRVYVSVSLSVCVWNFFFRPTPSLPPAQRRDDIPLGFLVNFSAVFSDERTLSAASTVHCLPVAATDIIVCNRVDSDACHLVGRVATSRSTRRVAGECSTVVAPVHRSCPLLRRSVSMCVCVCVKGMFLCAPPPLSSSPEGVRSTVMSVSVCLSVCRLA